MMFSKSLRCSCEAGISLVSTGEFLMSFSVRVPVTTTSFRSNIPAFIWIFICLAAPLASILMRCSMYPVERTNKL